VLLVIVKLKTPGAGNKRETRKEGQGKEERKGKATERRTEEGRHEGGSQSQTGGKRPFGERPDLARFQHGL
jgi:hypothetical protein